MTTVRGGWLLLALLALLLAPLGTSAQTRPSMRGVVVGGSYVSYGSAGYIKDPIGTNTNWRFGYRPDVPQSPLAPFGSVPLTWGFNSVFDGGYGFGDDWPLATQHVMYGPGTLPALDLLGRTTLYANNVGAWPGGSVMSLSANATFSDGDVININAAAWGGFYGVFHGSKGDLVADGFPWSSPGSDFGVDNTPFRPGPGVVNFYIYDVRGSTLKVDATGRFTYDLTSAPDPFSPITNKARGRLTIRRKDFGARYLYGANPPFDTNTNTVLMQGLWEIANVEGSFLDTYGGPFSLSDVNKAIGTYGQPRRFFPGVNYNDFNFRNLPAFTRNSPSTEKLEAYQFLASGLKITRTYDSCSSQMVLTVTNTGDIDLYNVKLTDSLLANGATLTGTLGAGSTRTFAFSVVGIPALAGIATATTTQFNIERELDLTGATGLLADGTALDSNDVTFNVSAASDGGTILKPCNHIAGVVFYDANNSGMPNPGEGVDNVTVTLTGTDLNNVPVTRTLVTSNGGAYDFTNLPPGTYTVTETVPSGYQAVNALPGVGGTKIDITTIGVAANTPTVMDYLPQIFTLRPLGSIGDRVWNDLNSDGIQDANEPGIPDVTVKLYDANGTLLDTKTTDSNGVYHFTNLPGAAYTVTVDASTLPAGFVPTYDLDGINTANTAAATLATGQNRTDVDFGYVGKGSLSGTLYVDANTNSMLDSGESKLGNVTVTLKDANGNVLATTTTAPDGTYSFTSLVAGTYTVDAPSTANGYSLETSNPLTVAVTAGQNTPNNDFGYVANGSLSGTLYVDANTNSMLDSGEAKLGNVTVTLKDANGNVIGTTTTAPDGTYSFANLVAGTYTVVAPSTANGYTLETLNPLTVTVTAGQDTSNNDFGYIANGSLSGTLYVDANTNSMLDSGEAKLGNVTVALKDGDGNVIGTTTTAPDGTYSFTNLVAGTYTVLAPSAAGGYSLETLNPLMVAVTVGQNTPNNNFGYIANGSLSGTLYVDANKNFSLDSGEAKLGNVTVTLKDGNGNVIGTTTTSAGGAYSFANLVAGTYTVVAPSTANGYTLETPSPLTVAVTAGQNTPNNNFGYIANGSLSGTLYVDANKNFSLDSGEAKLGNVTVTLKDANGNTLATTSTAADGTYSFTNLVAGTYTVVAPSTANGYNLETPSPLSVNVVAGQNTPNNNFGYINPAPVVGSLSGTLYVDANKNFSLDSGEAKLGGVTVTLKDGNGNPIASTTTAADGTYSFTNLTAGAYSVSAPSTANGYNLETPSPLSVNVVAGQNTPNNNFGYIAPAVPKGSLSGTLYVDANKNFSLDSGEAKLGGITVTLKDTNGNTLATTTTAADGTYSFTNLTAGTYSVSAPSTANGYTLETPSPLSVAVTAGQNTPNNNFGYIVPAPVVGSLSGTLYVDANKNFSLDSGEAKLGGITVTLKDANGNTLATTTTAADGTYSFTNLVAGTYTVVAPSTANGYNLETPSPLSVNVVAGQNTPNNNFGYITPVVVVGSLSGVAYVDLNGDKTYNVGEPLLSGVVITLTKPGGATTTTTTNASGYYQFTNLPAGSYTVSAPATTGGKTLVTSSPLTVTVVGGKDTPNNNFGYVTTNATGNFTTFTQGGWGTAPHGNNPGALLVNNFVKVFGTAGVTIGGNYTYKFTSATAVQNFLPQGGTPSIFTFSATNPTARTNVFAGQVLALQLSVSFSNAGITRNGLSSLTVVSGPLAGKTVAQVLALADAVLGGNTAALPSGLTVSGLNDIVTAINQNYDNGTTDNHYLH